jgi:hypothetical protein
MTNISKSPDRLTFQAKTYEEKLKEDPNDRNARAMVELYKKWREDAEVQEMDTEWQKNNLEYDLRTSEFVLNKVRNSDSYAQNLYAAMCNMRFQKLDVLPILKDEFWSCSWRHSGGIIANMQMKGDYIDWYCSGMGEGLGNGDVDGSKGYVPEGFVTDEIKEDLKTLGWLPVPYEDDKNV